MIVLEILSYIVGSFYALWIFYLAVMNLKRARENGTLTPVALVLGMPILAVGYLIDMAVNVFVTLIFWGRPRSWTVTGTLKYYLYKSEPGAWRETLAAWFCVHLLNAFDPDGKHC